MKNKIMGLKTNAVYCGDCKDVLTEFPENSVDLIYIDPPFFSGINYEKIWMNGAEDKAYQEYWRAGIGGFIRFMEGRLSLCKHVLKLTGSIYLHCDYHANARLRLLMDEIFREKNFQNEIIWHYRTGGIGKRWFGRKHDTILVYAKNIDMVKFIPIEIKEYYRDIYGNDFKPGWGDRKGGEDEKGYYRYAYMDDVWDIKGVFNMSKEYLGYPTQKPKELLERIISASSKKGQIVLDPMCGGGTTLDAAKELGRKFIGIDVSPKACEKTLTRLKMRQYEMIIIPNCVTHLEKMSPEGFQEWAVRRLGGPPSSTLSADGGIDGYTALDMIPIQTKRSRDIGSPPVRQFAADILTKGKKEGIFVALSFNEGAKKVIHELYNKLGVDIKLKTAENLFT